MSSGTLNDFVTSLNNTVTKSAADIHEHTKMVSGFSYPPGWGGGGGGGVQGGGRGGGVGGGGGGGGGGWGGVFK